MSCQFTMWGYGCFLLVQMPITMQMHMCFEHTSLRFLFYFDVLVTGDNYTQYKLITRETDWITSRQFAMRYLSAVTQVHTSVFKLQCWLQKILGSWHLKSNPLVCYCITKLFPFRDIQKQSCSWQSCVSCAAERLSYLTPNQLWICGRVLLWVSDNVNDRMDRHWREKRKIPINNWSCQKCFVSMQIYHLPSSKSFLV